MPRQPRREPWSRERLLHERAIALGLAIDISTSATYDSHLNSYLNFCTLHHFPVEPTPDTLSFYVVYMCANIKPRSVASYLTGICNKLEPYFPGVSANRKSILVARSLSVASLTRVGLVEVSTINDLPPNASHDSLLFAAMLTTGFMALLRLGEMSLPDNVAIRDLRKCSRRSTVTWFDDGYGFDLPYHKADRFFEGNKIRIIPTAMAEDGCAPHLIQAAGRWASNTFQIYIRKNPVLLQALLFNRTQQ
ncbi:hypothetical protein BDZ89DRAFT_945355 [Hymenopellis radicata]|nr:hypothetical protein BDZ89DRAFT_945355 [Hymenopellis radicata]